MVDFFTACVGGLRAFLFSCALFAAATYIQEIHTGWAIVCSVIKGRVRSGQIVGVASFGWFIGSISSMIMTSHRMSDAVFYGINPGAVGGGSDGIWTSVSLFGLALGYYIPVLAMYWYRGKVAIAIALGIIACIVGALFGVLTMKLMI